MQPDSITPAKRRGRRDRSPNGVEQEMRRANKQRRRKPRKPPASRPRTELRKRQQDKLRRARRKQWKRRRLLELLGHTVRRRVKAVRYYRHWRQRRSEREAVQRSASKFEVSEETIRRWERLYRQGGLAALLPKPPGPPSCGVVPLDIQFLVVALRRLLGWNEKRLAQELAQRGLAHLSHTTIGRIFARYHLPTRTYHSRARCDGLPKGRYEKSVPNQQWHVDFAETQLAFIAMTTALGIYINELSLVNNSCILAAWVHGIFNAQKLGVWSLLFPKFNPLLGGYAGVVGIFAWFALGGWQASRARVGGAAVTQRYGAV